MNGAGLIVLEISSLRNTEDAVKKIESAVGYANNHIPPDDSCMPVAQIPSELITKCVAALLMIQNITEQHFPPPDIAQILDYAIMILRPRSSHNLPIHTEI